MAYTSLSIVGRKGTTTPHGAINRSRVLAGDFHPITSYLSQLFVQICCVEPLQTKRTTSGLNLLEVCCLRVQGALSHCHNKAGIYLKGKDAESEEAQEHANSNSLALYV